MRDFYLHSCHRSIVLPFRSSDVEANRARVSPNAFLWLKWFPSVVSRKGILAVASIHAILIEVCFSLL